MNAFLMIFLSLSTPNASASSKAVGVTLQGPDAEALFVRLAKKDDELENRPRVRTKNGKHISCSRHKTGPVSSDYQCEMHIAPDTGLIYERHPVGLQEQAELKENKPYQSEMITIGGQGKDPGTAEIAIRGKNATSIYNTMTAQATDGKLDGEGQTSARIKNGEFIQCYQTTLTVDPITECMIKLKADSGEVQAPSAPKQQ